MNKNWLYGPNVKYKTIVIDPPWQTVPFSPTCGMKSKIKTQYKTMSDQEILDFDINYFAHNDCFLFLWTIQSKLIKSFEITKNWNFKHHKLLIWHKHNGITYNGIQNNAEFIIMAYKGNFKLFKFHGKAIDSCFYSRRTKHSAKPNVFYEMVNRKAPNPKIDIFARKRHEGFAAYGDQVEKRGLQQTTIV